MAYFPSPSLPSPRFPSPCEKIDGNRQIDANQQIEWEPAKINGDRRWRDLNRSIFHLAKETCMNGVTQRKREVVSLCVNPDSRPR